MKPNALKSLTLLWVSMAKQLRCFNDRDLVTLTALTSKYGIDFFTKVLPQLGKAVYSSFHEGKLVVPEGWTIRKGRPAFLRTLFAECYDTSGYLRTWISPRWLSERLRKLLQLTMFAYKIEIPLTTDMAIEAYDGLVRRQECLYRPIPAGLLPRVRQLIHSVIGDLDPADVIPRHGDGAVAEKGASTHHRWFLPFDTLSYEERIDNLFGYTAFFVNENHLVDEYHLMQNLYSDDQPGECGTSLAARITFVPKDSRGPRTICCEPATRQAFKLGLMDILYERITSSKFLGVRPIRNARPGRKTLGFIPLFDQTCMQELALAGSVTGELATLDLKDASDSVRWLHILDSFPETWVRAFAAIRSDTATVDLPGYENSLLKLTTAFPMGSAVCFPVEALIFWSISTAAMEIWGDSPGSTSFVFGDDTIVPTWLAQVVIEAFESCGFTVNVSKSYLSGNFRESCGGDYYCGHDLSIAKLKSFPTLTQGLTLQVQHSVVSFINRFNAIFDTDATFTDVFYPYYGWIPVLPIPSGDWAIHGSSRAGNSWSNLKFRWSPKLQRQEIRVPALAPIKSNLFPGNTSGWQLLYTYMVRGSSSTGDPYCIEEPRRFVVSWTWFPTFG